MKKIIIACVLAMGVLFLSGCSSQGDYEVKGGSISISDHEVQGTYEIFKGTYIYDITLCKGDALKLTFTNTTKSGSLSARIEQDNEVKLNINLNSEFVAEKDGTYQIVIEGAAHKGSFKLLWILK